jgi:hypothetical protein
VVAVISSQDIKKLMAIESSRVKSSRDSRSQKPAAIANSDANVEDKTPASLLGYVLQAVRLEALQCIFL